MSVSDPSVHVQKAECKCQVGGNAYLKLIECKADRPVPRDELHDLRWRSVEAFCRELDALTQSLSSRKRATDERLGIGTVLDGQWREWRNISPEGQAPDYRSVRVLVTEADGQSVKFEWVDGSSDWSTWIGMGIELFNGLVGAFRRPDICGLQVWYAWSLETGNAGHSQLLDAWEAWSDRLIDVDQNPQPLLAYCRFEFLD